LNDFLQLRRRIVDLLWQGLLAKCKVLPKNKRDFPILNGVSGVVRPGRQVLLF
jgi:hypothetical protein